ncbi:porin [Sutterella sp.]|uniref:porin n=1 Tax=Sutterella sp. TaxID=1981025 RepID=UPI0026DF6735|nr:porin [Sutterella sp.]MDO5531761.1 porin [Sutterella sp.]
MKKTVFSLAVACALCGTAAAADVTLYGVIDTGLNYTSVDTDTFFGMKHEGGDSFSMSSGQNSGTRFGLKGHEELGNGVTVGFVLENGFDSDTGALSQEGKIFGRESQVFVEGAYGKLSAGRVGLLSSDTGSFGILGDISAFGTGWGDTIGNQNLVFAHKPTRMNNVLTYVSPEFYGTKVHAQYAMGDSNENKPSADRYYALGATFSYGQLNVIGLADYTNKDSSASNTNRGSDMWTVTLGVNYDCGFATTYVAAQYFEDAASVGGAADDAWGRSLASRQGNTRQVGKSYGDVTGYGVVVGTNIPAFGGSALISVGYMDADSDKSGLDVKRIFAGAGYEYPLSNRTRVYGGAGYVRDDVDNTNPQGAEVALGLVHKF